MSRLSHELRRIRGRILRRADPVILMYHRVEEVEPDPWRLAVHPRHFEEQIEILTSCRRVVPLPWLVAEVASGRLPQNVACVTFDDGYVDVLSRAKPVLLRFDAPATVFLVTGALGRRSEFWWDALSRIVFRSERLPGELAIEIGGRRREWRIGPGVDRRSLYLDLWKSLRVVPQPSRGEILEGLERWAAAPAPRPTDRALDRDEVVRLFEPGFIEIGAHGVTHASLPSLPDSEKWMEMSESRAVSSALIGREVTAFAYPFGDRDPTTERIARECRFSHACGVERRAVLSNGDRFRLPRLAIEDWGGEELESRLHRGPRAFPAYA